MDCEAADQARKLRPEVILMDIRMPICDGLCATRIIKSELPEIKIVILTTSSEDQDLFEAIKSGASGYLLKSIDAESLDRSAARCPTGHPPFRSGTGRPTAGGVRPDDCGELGHKTGRRAPSGKWGQRP